MSKETCVGDLKFRIEQALLPIVTSDYILLDLPYYSNIGDALIWKGTETLLSKLPYHCLYRSSIRTFEFQPLPSNVVILMMGGGNFGDLYPRHNAFRKKILELYPDNHVIVLPQTVYYEAAKNARRDACSFRKHKHLTIFARDKYSYRFLIAFRFSSDVRLMPDMAFCINMEWLKGLSLQATGKTLYFKRIDKELNVLEENELSERCDVCDWPLYGQSDPKLRHLYSLIDAKHFAEADDYAVNTYLPERVRAGIEFISQYNKIYSNRLHGAILSILLGKKVVILDNSYGKNRQYYNSWLKDVDAVSLSPVTRKYDLMRLIRFSVHCILSYIPIR